MKEVKYCVECGKGLPSSRRKYCSYECSSSYTHRKFKRENPNPLRGNTSNTTGAISELRVAVDLMSKGFHVFRALSPSCPCDLAVLKDDNLLRVEVRTTYRKADGAIQRAKARRDDPNNIDVYAWVLPQGVVYEPEL